MNKADELKKEIFDKVKEYYCEVHNKSEFIPNESRVPYAGRVFDEEELINLVDASLEFWLTEGRYTDEFEKLVRDEIERRGSK